MNKEDYVSLEVAKLLKEKGFVEVCDAGYFIEDKDITPFHYGTCQNSGECYVAGYIGAPTLYEAQKWIREEKGLYVEVSYMSGDYYIYDILTIPQHDLIGLRGFERESADTYEECLNEGILEALKLI